VVRFNALHQTGRVYRTRASFQVISSMSGTEPQRTIWATGMLQTEWLSMNCLLTLFREVQQTFVSLSSIGAAVHLRPRFQLSKSF
jgi:hypothetical protein